MRFWETFHTHEFPWDRVAAGYWNRYPNQHSSHVFSVDTLETSIVDGKLYCRRLVIKTNPLPSWGKHFFNARRVPVVEECIVDPSNQELTWYVRNIGLNSFMATVEKATLYPDPEGNPGVTAVRKQCWIDSSILGFRSAIRKFGIDRYKKNSVLATQGFESVLERLNAAPTADQTAANESSADSNGGHENSPSTARPVNSEQKSRLDKRVNMSKVGFTDLNSKLHG